MKIIKFERLYMCKQNKGITLIALVLTIIVLLILAGVSISMITDNKILQNAGSAKEEYEKNSLKEKVKIDIISSSLDNMYFKSSIVSSELEKILNEYGTVNKNEDGEILSVTTDTGNSIDVEEIFDGNIFNESTVSVLKTSQKFVNRNTIALDDNNVPVIIPKGFKISSDSATTVNGGVVIEDSDVGENDETGNQFVWIPVDGENIILGRKTFTSTGVENNYSYKANRETKISYDGNTFEYYTSGEGSTLQVNSDGTNYSIENFVDSVDEYKGYYISRFEICDEEAEENRTSSSALDNEIGSKKDKIVYNYIKKVAASELATNMYASHSEITSALCNSYAYDTMLEYVIENSGITNYATAIVGNTKDATGGGELMKTGEFGEVACNIYDVGGNVREVTTEYNSRTYSGTNICDTVRGGTFGYDSTKFSAGSRSYMGNASEKAGFRVILYIN